MTYIQENGEPVIQRHVCSSLMERVGWILTGAEDRSICKYLVGKILLLPVSSWSEGPRWVIFAVLVIVREDIFPFFFLSHISTRL